MSTVCRVSAESQVRDKKCAKLRVNAIRGLWAVTVSRSRIAETELAPLKTLILNLARETGVRKSNRGGWHSSAARLLQAAALSPATSWLDDAILHAADTHVQSILDAAGTRPRSLNKLHLEIVDAWANINRAGHGNVVHSHPGLLSGVLYVDTGLDNETTRLCFADPRSGAHPLLIPEMEAACHGMIGAPRRPGTSIMDLKAGELVLFPSWLQHHVPLHQGDRPRISISFNIRARGGNAKEPSGVLSIPTSNQTVVPSEKFVQPLGRFRQLFENIALRFSSNLSQPLAFREYLEPPARKIASWRILPEDRVDDLAKSDIAGIWLCLAHALSAQLRGKASLLSGPLATASHLILPRGFVQTDRGKGANTAEIGAVGLHVVSGTLRLWLFDPRPMVEPAAASDVVARRLFGRKLAFQLEAGDIMMFPPWLEMSLDAEISHATALSFGFGIQCEKEESSQT